MDTYDTGRSFLRVPAKLNRNTAQDPEKIKMLISTERVADLVLLRIDEMETKDAAQPLAAPESGTASLNRCG